MAKAVSACNGVQGPTACRGILAFPGNALCNFQNLRDRQESEFYSPRHSRYFSRTAKRLSPTVTYRKPHNLNVVAGMASVFEQ